MRTRSLLAAVLLALPATGVAHATATSPNPAAPPNVTAQQCGTLAGALTANGSVKVQDFFATTPPSSTVDRTETPELFGPGQVRLPGSAAYDADYLEGSSRSGWMVLGDAMYSVSWFVLNETFDVEPGSFKTTKVGGGWGAFTAIETSRFDDSRGHARTTEYGLRGDGNLYRWTIDGKGVWHSTGVAPGFASVKTFTLISQTPTYDTLLANTRSGGLYTIHIPTTAAMKPVVKNLRTSTWQGFESLQAHRCGQYGTLLLAIDKDSDAGYLYAIGHANGASTVIQNRGKVPATFNEPILFNWVAPAGYDLPPYGE
ncbi:hypothetical protein OHA70_31845 [Kribbella sp. NBC_00382]|uniref:hypothetical protein n=1 Tax=Kribbella sp. NBC_00382 TaxID=2975967 RepID=UPI002E1D7A73